MAMWVCYHLPLYVGVLPFTNVCGCVTPFTNVTFDIHSQYALKQLVWSPTTKVPCRHSSVIVPWVFEEKKISIFFADPQLGVAI